MLVLRESTDPSLEPHRLRISARTGQDLMEALGVSQAEICLADGIFEPLQPGRIILRHRMVRIRVNDDQERNSFLSIQGRFIKWEGFFQLPGGKSLAISQDSSRPGTGGSVWDGALIMATHLCQSNLFEDADHVVELGSGVGLVGLVAAALAKTQKIVTLTDLPECLPLINENIKQNSNLWRDKEVVVRSQELDWLDSDHKLENPPDVILVADCVWMRELVEPLLHTLRRLCRKDTLVYISYQRRGRDTHAELMRGLHRWFNINELALPSHLKQQHAMPSDTFFLFRGKIKKAEK